MITTHIDLGRITSAILMGQLGNTEIRIIGMVIGILLAVILLFLPFYVGNPEPERSTTATESTKDSEESSELYVPDPAYGASGPAASGTLDVSEVLQVDDGDHGEETGEEDMESLDGSEERERERERATDEQTPTPGEGTLTHETLGERGRGLLVEVMDGDRSEEFFVRDWTGPDPSISTAAPHSRHDNDWLADAREYLRERAIHGNLSTGEID